MFDLSEETVLALQASNTQWELASRLQPHRKTLARCAFGACLGCLALLITYRFVPTLTASVWEIVGVSCALLLFILSCYGFASRESLDTYWATRNHLPPVPYRLFVRGYVSKSGDETCQVTVLESAPSVTCFASLPTDLMAAAGVETVNSAFVYRMWLENGLLISEVVPDPTLCWSEVWWHRLWHRRDREFA